MRKCRKNKKYTEKSQKVIIVLQRKLWEIPNITVNLKKGHIAFSTKENHPMVEGYCEV